MKLLTILFLFYATSMMNAYSYTIAIYTDQPGGAKANEIIETFKKTYPFNQFDITYEVKQVNPEELDCSPMEGIARNLGCNSGKIAAEATAKGIDQVAIVKNVQEYGGSGGSIPVISVASPARTILHEYLHTLGLCDEYEYAASEAPIYCNEGGANMAMIEPAPNGYASDQEARTKHRDQIRWYSNIKDQTHITHGNQLGTGSVSQIYSTPNATNEVSKMSAAVGLYEGKRCNKMNPPKKSWQPGGEATIMEFVAAGLGAGNEQIVANALESRGVRRKNLPVENTPISVNDSNKNKEFDWATFTKDKNETSTTSK